MSLVLTNITGVGSFERAGGEGYTLAAHHELWAFDLNGDGIDEFITAGFETQPNSPEEWTSTRISIWGWQNGLLLNLTEQWLPGDTSIIDGAGDIVFGDYNGDGMVDVYVSADADMDYEVHSYQLINTGNSFQRTTLKLWEWEHGATSGDINNDGYDDVIIASYTIPVHMYLGSASGLIAFSYDSPNVDNSAHYGSAVTTGDFLGTGQNYVIVTDHHSVPDDTVLLEPEFDNANNFIGFNIFSHLPAPIFDIPTYEAGSTDWTDEKSHDIRIETFDFSDDGLSDVIVFSRHWLRDGQWPEESTIQFLQNMGNGEFTDVTNELLVGHEINYTTTYAPLIDDFNLDGLPDIFISGASYGLEVNRSTMILLQQQDGTFEVTGRDEFSSLYTTPYGGELGTLIKGPDGGYYFVAAQQDFGGITNLTMAKLEFSDREESENLHGTIQDDTMFGFGGDDMLSGGRGGDTINGGDGIDTVIFSGDRFDYLITDIDNRYTVTDSVGTDGSDLLNMVEKLEFTDYIVNLTVQDAASSIDASALQTLQELYVAFFNRVPDGDGLEYWIDQYKSGLSVNDIAEQFYQAGIQYSDVTGFSASMTNTDFINVVYGNVLGRPEGPDEVGLNYWNNALTNGDATKATLVAEILNAAHTYKGDAEWGWVADLLDNKIEVANTFAVEYGLNYHTPEESITGGMAIAAAVTSDDTSVAIELIGVVS